jgi:hypothetical protein
MLEQVSELASFLRLNKIPLYGIQHTNSANPFIDGRWHLLALVNNAAVYLFNSLLSIFLGLYPDVELLDQMEILLKSLRNHQIFPQQLHHFTPIVSRIPISTHSLQCLLFSVSYLMDT